MLICSIAKREGKNNHKDVLHVAGDPTRIDLARETLPEKEKSHLTMERKKS